MLEDFRRAEAAAAAYFMDSKIAASAAVSEVRAAAMHPEAARAIRRKFAKRKSIRQEDAVLVHAIERGRLWLFITPVVPSVEPEHSPN